MGVSRRGLRSILSRKSRKSSSYSELENENDVGYAQQSTASTIPEVRVSVATSQDAAPELECVNGVDNEKTHDDNISSPETKIATETPQEEEKTPEEYSPDVFEATRQAAIDLVRSASTMTDTMAKKLVFTSAVPSGSNGETAGEEKEAEKADEIVDDENVVQRELNKKYEEACQCGNGLVETSKEVMDTAVQKTQQTANDLVEASKDMMTSTEACSQAAISDGLPLPPIPESLQKTSKQVESAVAEVPEFFIDLWALLNEHIDAHKRKSPESTPPKEDNVVNVTVEVQVKPTE